MRVRNIRTILGVVGNIIKNPFNEYEGVASLCWWKGYLYKLKKWWGKWLWSQFGIAKHLVLILCFISWRTVLVGKSNHLRSIYFCSGSSALGLALSSVHILRSVLKCLPRQTWFKPQSWPTWQNPWFVGSWTQELFLQFWIYSTSHENAWGHWAYLGDISKCPQLYSLWLMN